MKSYENFYKKKDKIKKNFRKILPENFKKGKLA